MSFTIHSSAYGMAMTFTVSTSIATASASADRCTYAIANISAVITAHCTANNATHVEILFAAAINSSVMNRNAADEASAFVAASSNSPIGHHLVIPAKTTAKMASANATPRKSGTRYIRSFAIPLSTTEIATTITTIFSRNANSARAIAHTDRVVAMPHGANSPISSAE